jgi:ferredoxin/flavodoxin
MKTVLYYYSATGNSLVIAREVARALGGAEVLPIASSRSGTGKIDAERVGFIFPIIAWGPPRTVEEFIDHFDPTGLRYIFAIASCGGTAALTLPNIRKTLRKKGSDLNAGFIVGSKAYLSMSGGSQSKMINLVSNLSGKLLGGETERLPSIIETIANCETKKPERNALPGAILGSFLHSAASPQFAKMDANYVVDAGCTGCGVCARLCPRENIVMVDGKPTWKNDCDFCGACANWCPSASISMKGDLAPARAHNQEVKLADFYLR